MTLHDDPTTLTLTILKAITVVFGLLIVYLGAKAYRRSGRKPLLWLTVGMTIMTLGALSEGIAYQGLKWTIEASHVFEGIVTLVAFIVLVWSLYA